MADNATSQFQRLVTRGMTAWSAEDALDCAGAIVAINNIEHAADEAAYVRVCDPMEGEVVNADAATWYLMKDYGTFPLTIGPEGQPYRLRVRLAGRRAGSGNVTFRMVIGDPSNAPAEMIDAGAGTLDFTIASTAASWASPGLDYIEVAADDAERLTVPVSVAPSIGSAYRVSASQTIVRATIWANRATGKDDVRLSGCYIAELIG